MNPVTSHEERDDCEDLGFWVGSEGRKGLGSLRSRTLERGEEVGRNGGGNEDEGARPLARSKRGFTADGLGNRGRFRPARESTGALWKSRSATVGDGHRREVIAPDQFRVPQHEARA